MIRWARYHDSECGIDAESVSDWQHRWIRRWIHMEGNLATGVDPQGSTSGASRRPILIARLSSSKDLESALQGFRESSTPPGTRLVMTIPVGLDEQWAEPSITRSSACWVEEVPHLCDPFPGDPRANGAWFEDQGILMVRGRSMLGVLVVRILRREELTAARFECVQPPTSPALHFPGAESIPLPDDLKGASQCTVFDIAEAFGVTLESAHPLVNEMLASGLIRPLAGRF